MSKKKGGNRRQRRRERVATLELVGRWLRRAVNTWALERLIVPDLVYTEDPDDELRTRYHLHARNSDNCVRPREGDAVHWSYCLQYAAVSNKRKIFLEGELNVSHGHPEAWPTALVLAATDQVDSFVRDFEDQWRSLAGSTVDDSGPDRVSC